MLDDRTVLITGAGRGLGRGIAEAVFEAGGRLVVTDLDAAAAAETAGRLGGAGDRVLALPLDVTDRTAVAAAIERAVAAWGRLDGWVNNAGAIRMGAALDATPEDWDLQLEVNVKGLFACCQLAARQMIAQGGGGAIVNVASNAGKAGYPNMSIYNATKAAVISLTRSLAAEWAEHRINVVAICPGGVDTPMLAGCAEWIAGRFGGDPEELVARMAPRQLGRLIRPLEIGRLAAFLLSDGALMLRGQSITADGGDTPY